MSLETLRNNIYNPKIKYANIYNELKVQQDIEIRGLCELYFKERTLCKDVVKYIIYPMLKTDIEKRFSLIVKDLQELEWICRRFPYKNQHKKKMYNEIREHHGLN